MEDPVSEIPRVIRLLTQSRPSLQEETVDRYFTPTAEFAHPFCRVWSFAGSRWVVTKIFQWYKIMSPHIEIDVHSVAYDRDNLRLYVTISQIFSIWLVPFHRSPVTLTTVLDLTPDPGDDSTSRDGKIRYYIRKQEDLYQTSEFIKFVVPHVGHLFVMAFHAFAAFFCILAVFVFYPIMWLEEKGLFSYQNVREGIADGINKNIPNVKTSRSY